MSDRDSRAGDPSEADLASPEFSAVWKAIRRWDIERSPSAGRAHATGTDVMTILRALRDAGLLPQRRTAP